MQYFFSPKSDPVKNVILYDFYGNKNNHQISAVSMT